MTRFTRLGYELVHDARHAGRSLSGNPGFALAAILTIALGVGVNTGMFSVLNAVAFRDLPATEPDELVAVSQSVRGVPRGQNNSAEFSTAEYELYRDESETLSGVLAYARMWIAFMGRERPQQIVATPVSCNFFEVLRLAPEVGGGFSAQHCASEGDAAVTVITHGLWMDRYGGDPSILGQIVTVNGSEFRVVGVATEGFAGIDIDRPSLFVPLQAQRLLRPDRNLLEEEATGWLNVIGRRAPGVSIAQVEADLRVVAGQLDLAQAGRSTTVNVARATALSAPGMRTGVLGAASVVMTAFGLVLLVACTNVANLMLARADMRMRETAIRLSLGATRARLIRQLVTESVLIALAGGLIGALLAVWTFEGLLATGLAALPAGVGTLLRVEPEPDLIVFGFAAAISLLAGVGFGLAPALRATRPTLRTTLQQDAAGAGGRRRGHLQGALVGVQVAFSMVLVVTTALLLRGLYEAQSVDPGFDHEVLVVATTDMQSFGYDGARAWQLQRQAVDAIDALPGVEGVAQALNTPLEMRASRYTYRRPDEALSESRTVQTNNVSANYFDVTGIPIVRGRAFTEPEVAAEQPSTVILTESTALSFWPDTDPLGQTLIFAGFAERSLEVIGIARDAEVVAIGQTDTSYLYLPAAPSSQNEMQLVIRTALAADSLREPITALFARFDSQLPVRVQPLAANFEIWARLSGLAASLAFALGTLALVLAAVGVFGVMSTVVASRVREIGVRVAVGAGSRDVLALVFRKSMLPVAIGATVGGLACFGAARLLSGLLFGIGALDPYALAGAAAAVLGAAFLASAIPARRAMSVDPMAALRYE